MSTNVILEMRNITKTFPGVKALSDVSFSVEEGEIHALCGENGAGKSTLMKVLSGVYPYGTYDGDIYYNGELKKFGSIKDTEEEGIIIIHQELALIPMLSIAENIFLGNEVAKGGVINWAEATRRTTELLAKVGLKENPSTLITNIGVGKQQLVEIAKALSKKVKLLILDEPTASLNESDSNALLDLLLEFKKQGLTSIIISHKLNEISRVADKITVLRDGATVETLDCHAEKISEARIIRGMVGRELSDRFPKRVSKLGETIFEVRNWTAYHPIHSDRKISNGINLRVHRGEVVGIAGLVGAGRTELARAIFGADPLKGGSILVNGQPARIRNPADAIALGIAYIAEDRRDGLFMPLPVKENITCVTPEAVASAGVIRESSQRRIALDYIKRLNIRTPSPEQQIRFLSGGNQQKCILARWIIKGVQTIIFDEPTRGIDVGAKTEIYRLIDQLAREGKSVILISSELPEILGMSDRVLVMERGRLSGEVDGHDATEENLLALALPANPSSHELQP